MREDIEKRKKQIAERQQKLLEEEEVIRKKREAGVFPRQMAESNIMNKEVMDYDEETDSGAENEDEKYLNKTKSSNELSPPFTSNRQIKNGERTSSNHSNQPNSTKMRVQSQGSSD